MKHIADRMNMKFGVVDRGDAYTIEIGKSGAHDALRLICHELNIDLTEVTYDDFDSTSIILADFCSSANEETGSFVSVWFDL